MSDTQKQHQGSELQLVTFELAGEEFAIDILKVQEIHRILEITTIPRSPAWIHGVMNLRGKIIPVVDLRNRFSLPPAERTRESRIVVVEVADKTLGFLVDRVNEVLRISASTVEPPPPMVAGVDSRFIQGVGKRDSRLFILLDLDMLLGQDMLEALNDVEQVKEPALV